MKFYQLKHSTDLKVIGRYLQTERIVNEEQYYKNKDSSLHRASLWNRISDEVIIPDHILGERAKKTDLISTSLNNHLLVISDLLREKFESVKTETFQLFETKIICKNRPYNGVVARKK